MAENPYVLSHPPETFPLGKSEADRPLQLDVELTERCNNGCIHCCVNRPANNRQAQLREWDTDAWKRLFDAAADLGVLTLRMTGGEPLLRPDFPELYLHARKLGMKVLLFTNATLITPSLADLLADIPPLEPIEVSVYGMSRATYEAISCRAGSHARFLGGIQCLLDKKISFVVKMVVLPPNKKELRTFSQWAAGLYGKDATPVSATFLELRSRRKTAAQNARIRALRLSPEEGLALLTQEPERYRREMAVFFNKYTAPPGPALFTCGLGPGCIDAYGVFQPCMGLRHPGVTFDLKTGSLKEAMSFLYPRLRIMTASDPQYLARCARCFLRGMCEQCPARSWSEHGTLDTPVEYLCQVAHGQARYLGLLQEGEAGWEVTDVDARINDLTRRVASG